MLFSEIVNSETFQFLVKLVEIGVAITVPLLVGAMVALVKVIWSLNNRTTALENKIVEPDRIAKLENTMVTQQQARDDRKVFHDAIQAMKVELKQDLSEDLRRLETAVRDLWTELKEHRHK